MIQKQKGLYTGITATMPYLLHEPMDFQVINSENYLKILFKLSGNVNDCFQYYFV